MEGTYKKKDTGEIYKKKFKKRDTDEVFKHCLGKVYNHCIKKYDARKQQAYMRAGLLKSSPRLLMPCHPDSRF